MPSDSPSGLPNAPVSVAFDSNFTANGVIYAAAFAADSGVYRFRTRTSFEWESIDTTLPAGGSVRQVIVSPDGVLYGIDGTEEGGMERSLEPARANPSFTTVTRGLSAGTAFEGLWQAGDSIWSIDTMLGRLWRFDDTLTRPRSRRSCRNRQSPGRR